MNQTSKVIIFTDGASSGNPGPGGWGAVLVIPAEVSSEPILRGKENGRENKEAKVIELGGQEEHTTNNRMELAAVAEALSFVKDHGRAAELVIYTDSRYVINGMTKWISGWSKNGWQTAAKKDVVNRDLWERLVELVAFFDEKKITWRYVKGHVGIQGNERADQIATGNKNSKLYQGPVSKYPYQLNLSALETTINSRAKSGPSDPKKSGKKSRSRAAAYSYVSIVDGMIMTHATWVECESRVKGMSGAKFKKALDSDEEKKIIQEFSQKI